MIRELVRNPLRRLSSCLWIAGIACACGPLTKTQPSTSSPLVSDVAHTTAKRQSIGNCWLYAAGSWVESLALTYQNKSMDVSESYWTWWHFYDGLLSADELDKLQTGGSWNAARSIILKHGVVAEGDFLPSETDQEMSSKQKEALDFINAQLATDSWKDPSQRTPEKVRALLDEAFASDMAQAEAKAIPADQLLIRSQDNAQNLTLKDLLEWRSPDAWSEVPFPRLFGADAVASRATQKARQKLWQRVFRALNDNQPVLISLMIDFNGLDNTDGTFKGERLQQLGVGTQGGHLTVLEDYTVRDVPGVGAIGRGDVGDEMQEKALSGTLDLLVAKNSWGVNRPDRGIRDGLTSFDRAYLEGQFAWKDDVDKADSPVHWYTTLSSFVLPPGY